MIKKIIAVISALCMSLAILTFSACTDKNGNIPDADEPCVHDIVKVEPKDADCLNEGYYAHYACTKCGAIFGDRKGEKPVSEDKIRIEKLPHAIQVQNETVGNYTKFYYCTSCGHYFADSNGQTEIPYSELTDNSVTPVKIADLQSAGNLFVTRSFNSQSEFEDITGDFTLRMFAGWRSTEGKSITEFPSGQTVQVNFNLNRIETITPPVPGDIWYNFGLVYNKASGLGYKKLQSNNALAKAEFNSLFLEKGGIYIIVVRKGTTVSFYFEDKFGMPRLIDTNNDFGGSGNLVRFAANVAVGADGWVPFVKNAAICLGIANPRCLFETE